MIFVHEMLMPKQSLLLQPSVKSVAICKCSQSHHAELDELLVYGLMMNMFC